MRILIKARFREQSFLGGAKHRVYTLEVNLEAWKSKSGRGQFCRPFRREIKVPKAGTGDDDRITGGATHTETNTARPVLGEKEASTGPFIRTRGAVELIVGEESERRGKVVVRHCDLKATETPIRAVSNRHCIANYAGAESGMLKHSRSGKGGDRDRSSEAEGEHVVLSGCLLMQQLNLHLEYRITSRYPTYANGLAAWQKV